MKLLPSVDITNPGSSGMNQTESIIVVTLSYLSVLAFTPLLLLGTYNIYTFLVKQRKYQVYPLVLFYLLAMPCLIMRILVPIFIIPIIQNF